MEAVDFTICECLECECYNYVSVYEEDGNDAYLCEDCILDHTD